MHIHGDIYRRQTKLSKDAEHTLQRNYSAIKPEAKRLKLDKRGYRNPVIALTAHAMSEEQVKTRSAGFAGHLTKPLVAAELLKTVARFGKALHLSGEKFIQDPESPGQK